MKYKAVAAKVILKAEPPPSEDASQLIIPESVAKAVRAKAKPIIELEILAVGPDCKVARPGDKAAVNTNHVNAIPLPDGTWVAIIPEAELIAVLEKVPCTQV
jgi:hypothetical protein